MCTVSDSLEMSSNVSVDSFESLFWTHSVTDLNCIYFVVASDSNLIHILLSANLGFYMNSTRFDFCNAHI